jgi:hypothetical protein
MEIKKKDLEFYAQIVIIVVLVGILMYNLGQSSTSGASIAGGGIGVVSASDVIPTGVPNIYGEELNLNYDYVSPNDKQLADQTISFLSNIDRTETLEGAELERYIDILYNLEGGISCEYCCGARSVIFENGQPACGCAHSYAMRGLAKYLIKYHPEMSDEEIFIEIAKWKTLFFPGIMEGKAQVLADNGIEFNYINLASNKYRDIEKGQASGGMVGGC